MNPFSSFDLISTSLYNPNPYPSPLSFFDLHLEEDSPIAFALDLLNPSPSPLDLLPTTFDLIQIPSASGIRTLQQRSDTDGRLRSLSDRVAALEIGLDRALTPSDLDRKYKWTTEIKGGKVDRKYTWTVELKAGEEEKKYKWTAETKGEGRDGNRSRTYSFEASTAPEGKMVNKKKAGKKKKEIKKVKNVGVQLAEIDENNPGTVTIRKAFAKYQSKGKRKELSPQDAAVTIQMAFRSHLLRRSQVVRCLRDLAVAKAKLKEIRGLFYNFSYRRSLTKDAEERQRFTEKVIVLLLTVEAIEGPDYMVRSARNSMVEELEYMLDVVDPQPPGKLGSLKRRNFDLPIGGPISREMSRGVAEVIQMLDEN